MAGKGHHFPSIHPSPIHPPPTTSPEQPLPAPPSHHLQGFLHNKTLCCVISSPDLEIITLSQHLIGKQWKGGKPLLLCRSKTGIFPPIVLQMRCPKSPRSSAVSNEGVSKDPPARSSLSETDNGSAASPISTETRVPVRRHSSVARSPRCTKCWRINQSPLCPHLPWGRFVGWL